MAQVEAAKRSLFRASGAAQPSPVQGMGKEAASVQAGSLVAAAPLPASATGALWGGESASAKALQSAFPAATWEAQLAGVARRRMLPAVG